jgi:hypothetical protein
MLAIDVIVIITADVITVAAATAIVLLTVSAKASKISVKESVICVKA